MHDIALLKKLTPEQLKFVIENDPNTITTPSLDLNLMVFELTAHDVHADTIAELIRSMGSKLAARDKGQAAFEYLNYADRCFKTKTAYAYAMESLRPELLKQVGDAKWYDFLHLGNDAIKAEKFDVAWNAYSYAMPRAIQAPINKPKMINGKLVRPRPHAHFVLKAIKRLWLASLHHLNLDVYSVCTELLEANGKKINTEHHHRRIALVFFGNVDHIANNTSLRDDMLPLLKTIVDPDLRNGCLEAVALEGSYDFLQELALLWGLTIPDRCLRLLLGVIWPKNEKPDTNTDNDDDKTPGDDSAKSAIRLKVLRELVGRSAENADRYKSMLKREILIATDHALEAGHVQDAHKLATESKQPLTLDELETLVRTFAGRVPYDKEHIPFAIDLMVKLVTKEKRKK